MDSMPMPPAYWNMERLGTIAFHPLCILPTRLRYCGVAVVSCRAFRAAGLIPLALSVVSAFIPSMTDAVAILKAIVAMKSA